MMTLRQLINHVMDRGAVMHVMSCIYNCYYSSKHDEFEDVVHSYTHVIREMINLDTDAEHADHQIVLHEVADNDQSHVDVFLRLDDQTYAIDYIDWTKLIDIQVCDEIGLQAHDVLAHVLWEMTFHGFTNARVKQSRESLESLCGSMSGA